MHRPFALSAALVVALVASVSTAGAQRRTALGLSAGATVPVGDAGDAFGTGFNVAVALNITGTPKMPLAFRIEGMWNKLLEKDDSGVDLRVLAGTANLVVNIPNPSSVVPYLIGGAGIYNTKADANTARGALEAESSSDLGVNGGFGVRFGLSGFSTFAEARFHNVFGDNSSNFQFIPITFGILF